MRRRTRVRSDGGDDVGVTTRQACHDGDSHRPIGAEVARLAGHGAALCGVAFFRQRRRMFHVTSSANRASIRFHGLDWRFMDAAPGIAGSRVPEQRGCFVCQDEDEVEWFVRMNNTGGPVDVWAIDGVRERALKTSPEGHLYLPTIVPPDRLTLVRTDIPPAPRGGAQVPIPSGRWHCPSVSDPG